MADRKVFTPDEFEGALTGRPADGLPTDQDADLQETAAAAKELAQELRKTPAMDKESISLRQAIKEALLPGQNNLDVLRKVRKELEQTGYAIFDIEEAERLYNAWRLAWYEAGHTYWHPQIDNPQHGELIGKFSDWLQVYPHQRLVHVEEKEGQQLLTDCGTRYDLSMHSSIAQNYFLDHARSADPLWVQQRVINHLNTYWRTQNPLDPEGNYRVAVVVDQSKLPKGLLLPESPPTQK